MPCVIDSYLVDHQSPITVSWNKMVTAVARPQPGCVRVVTIALSVPHTGYSLDGADGAETLGCDAS